MITSGVLYRLMWLLNITIDIRNVCVFLAPFFSSLTTIVTYLLTKEIHVSFHRSLMCGTEQHLIFQTILERWCWPGCCCYDFHCSGLHFPIGCRFVRQRRHCDILHAVDVLLLDKIGQNWRYIMVNDVGIGIFLHGVVVGRLRIFDQFNSIACASTDGNWSIFASDLCRIQHSVLRRYDTVDANQFRWIPTGTEFRTYAGEC